jgi:hypothetical protein
MLTVVQVYDKKSSSRCWLEKHVPLHGGKFAFTCIVEGCKLRFSSQVHPSTCMSCVTDPGCLSRIQIFFHLGSRLPDPGSDNKKEG